MVDIGGGGSIEVAAVRARGARGMTDASGREAQGRMDITTSVLWCGICNRTPEVIREIGQLSQHEKIEASHHPEMTRSLYQVNGRGLRREIKGFRIAHRTSNTTRGLISSRWRLFGR